MLQVSGSKVPILIRLNLEIQLTIKMRMTPKRRSVFSLIFIAKVPITILIISLLSV